MQKPSNTAASTGKVGADKIRPMLFEPLNNYFDKIYVITLKRATDRHLHIIKELEGLNFEFMYGCDKINLKKDELIENKQFDPELASQHHIMGKEMNMGEIACSISHKMVYEDVVKNNFSRVLIMEDDIIIDRKNISLFENISKELPNNWGMLYLGFAKNEQPPKMAFFKKAFYHLLFATGIKKQFNHKVINNLYPKNYSNHLNIAGFHDCAHAYAITGNTAKIFLQMQSPLSYIADHLLAYAACNKTINAFTSNPKLIHQQYQVSTTPIKSYINQ